MKDVSHQQQIPARREWLSFTQYAVTHISAHARAHTQNIITGDVQTSACLFLLVAVYHAGVYRHSSKTLFMLTYAHTHTHTYMESLF